MTKRDCEPVATGGGFTECDEGDQVRQDRSLLIESLAEQKRRFAKGIVVYPYHAIRANGKIATGLALGKTIVASDLPVFRELLADCKMDCLSTRKIPPNQRQL
jgi:hypothetical protein